LEKEFNSEIQIDADGRNWRRRILLSLGVGKTAKSWQKQALNMSFPL